MRAKSLAVRPAANTAESPGHHPGIAPAATGHGLLAEEHGRPATTYDCPDGACGSSLQPGAAPPPPPVASPAAATLSWNGGPGLLGGAGVRRQYFGVPGGIPTVQAKLSISRPGDPLEREADRTAETILGRPAESTAQPVSACAAADHVQRRCAPCEEEETVQRQAISSMGRAADVESIENRPKQDEPRVLPASASKSASVVGGAGPAPTGAAAPGVFVPTAGGRPLERSVQSWFEPRLGTDLASVRVHDDARAAGSARSLQALAFTAGDHIVFGAGQYAPHTPGGRKLLAHELVHTVQQARSIGRSGPDRIVQRQQPPTQAGTATAGVGGSPYSTLLPGYSQQGDTCGAAPLVTALMIWDREHWNAAEPNSRVVTACNLILADLARHGRDAVRRFAARPAPEVRRICGTDQSCVETAYNAVWSRFGSDLQRIRDSARRPGAVVPEADYQAMGLALYFLWREAGGGGFAGLSSTEISRIQRSLGLETSASGNVQSFDELFSHSIVTNLQPDQFAQALWLVNTGGQHSFLIGRLQSGEWFLSDQGPSPPAEFRSATLASLRATVRAAAASGTYWLFTGTSVEFINRYGTLPGFTGVTRLGPQTAPEARAQAMVSPGARLGEVDAGVTTIGQMLTATSFVARRYSLTDAQAALPGGAGGGLIVELPSGVFSVYTTSSVSDANLGQTSLDVADSAGTLLVSRTFFHAWLILGTSSGRRGSWFRVY